MEKKRGRPVCLERLADPLVPIEVPLSVRNELNMLKVAKRSTYGDLIAAMLIAAGAREGVECRKQ